MKKTTKNLLMVGVVGVFGATALASCSNATESYANKINKKAEASDAVTYEQAKKALGKECIDITVANTGVLVAVKGCKTKEDIQAKLDEGKTLKGIVVTVVLGSCTGAVYREITTKDVK